MTYEILSMDGDYPVPNQLYWNLKFDHEDDRIEEMYIQHDQLKHHYSDKFHTMVIKSEVAQGESDVVYLLHNGCLYDHDNAIEKATELET